MPWPDHHLRDAVPALESAPGTQRTPQPITGDACEHYKPRCGIGEEIALARNPISAFWLSLEPSFLGGCRLTCRPISQAWLLLGKVSRPRVFSLPVSRAPPPKPPPVQWQPFLCPWPAHRFSCRWLPLPKFPNLTHWLPPPR